MHRRNFVKTLAAVTVLVSAAHSLAQETRRTP